MINKALDASMCCAIATTMPDGAPHITPIGSILLTSAGNCIFFDKYSDTMTKNLARNNRVCMLFVHSGKWNFLYSLFKGAWSQIPALRLYGEVSDRRLASPEEVAAFKKAVRPFRWLKGYDLLWKNEGLVRDVKFDAVRQVNMGGMVQETFV